MAISGSGTEHFDSTITLPQSSSENAKESGDPIIPLIDTTTTRHRKHRFTIFIGYGEEACCVLKRCEQLKCKLGLGTNIQFLTYLIEFFEERNSEYRSNEVTADPEICRQSSETIPSYIYDVKFKTFNTPSEKTFTQNITHHQENQNFLGKNNEPSLTNVVVSITPTCNEKQVEQPVLQQVQQLKTVLINHHDLGVNHVQVPSPPPESQNSNEVLHNPSELPSCSIDDTVSFESNIFSSITPKRKSQADEYENTEAKPQKSATFNDAIVPDPPVQGVDAVIKPIDITASLTISSLNMKALKVIHQYMENIKNNLSYYHGYISSSEKLKSFLHDYRTATYTSFTVRSSRSYVKKRALNALKSIRNENGDFSEMDSITVNDDVRLFNQHESNLINTIKCSNANFTSPRGRRRRADDSCELNSSDEIQSGMDDDNMLTGPLRWEFILGKPPIPFTGIPFFIIGNTQYQCYYATADIRTQRRKEKIAKILKENPGVKTRIRRSMKRDCKAVMCIKSIVTFPEFSVVEQLQGVKSKKGCRKLKATTLDNLREVVEKGDSIGHPAFWVHIPLPEAHTTHDIVGSSEKVSDQGNMEEIAHILELAAQYGGQLEISEESTDNIAHLKINDTGKQLANNQSLAISNDFLCVGDPNGPTIVTSAVNR